MYTEAGLQCNVNNMVGCLQDANKPTVCVCVCVCVCVLRCAPGLGDEVSDVSADLGEPRVEEGAQPLAEVTRWRALASSCTHRGEGGGGGGG